MEPSDKKSAKTARLPPEGSGQTPARETLALDKLVTDARTQVRAEISEYIVGEYVDALGEGARFPPVVVFRGKGADVLADGFHRLRAYQQAGRSEIEADVYQGDRDDALWFALGANRAHGPRLSGEDKRRAIEIAYIGLRRGREASSRLHVPSPSVMGSQKHDPAPCFRRLRSLRPSFVRLLARCRFVTSLSRIPAPMRGYSPGTHELPGAVASSPLDHCSEVPFAPWCFVPLLSVLFVLSSCCPSSLSGLRSADPPLAGFLVLRLAPPGVWRRRRPLPAGPQVGSRSTSSTPGAVGRCRSMRIRGERRKGGGVITVDGAPRERAVVAGGTQPLADGTVPARAGDPAPGDRRGDGRAVLPAVPGERHRAGRGGALDAGDPSSASSRRWPHLPLVHRQVHER